MNRAHETRRSVVWMDKIQQDMLRKNKKIASQLSYSSLRSGSITCLIKCVNWILSTIREERNIARLIN